MSYRTSASLLACDTTVRLLILWWYEVLPEWYRLIAGDLDCFTAGATR
jgi:hypothetical protein